MVRSAALPAISALLALLVLAGCIGSGPTVPKAPATNEPSTTGLETATVETSTDGTRTTRIPTVPQPVNCGDVWVAFYAVGTDVQDRLWDPDSISIGYTVPGGSSLLFVAYENGSYRNGTVLGVEHVEVDTGYPITADGHGLSLDEPLSGEHTVRVVVHRDVNGNGGFDRGVDAPCLSDGELARAGPGTFDFSEFADDS